MTIAITIKVNDGVVLAVDSATTMLTRDAAGNQFVQNVYENGIKAFNLLKSAPIGAITWGAGSIGVASMATLAKDFRRCLSGDDDQHTNWEIDLKAYTIQEVAERLRAFLYEERYQSEYAALQPPGKPSFGFIVAGYSAGAAMAEEYLISVDEQGNCPVPQLLRPPNEAGANWFGQPEAISRLLLGFSPQIGTVLQTNLGVRPEQVQPTVDVLQQALQANMIIPAMPIQDAIDLAEFFVELTIKFTRFCPGAQTVGGPIEVAAITKHEGFKWVRRKYYYSRELNPEG